MDEIRKLEISAAARESILTEVKSIESGLYTIINLVSKELTEIDDKRAKQAIAIKSFNQMKTMVNFNPKTDISQVSNYKYHPSMTGGIVFPSTDSCRNALADMQVLMQAGLYASFAFAFEQIDQADNVIASGRTPVAVTGANTAVNNRPTNNQTWTYYIKRGDTLSAIAKRYNTTVEELCRLNNISNPNMIIAGAALLIPLSGLTGGKTTPFVSQRKTSTGTQQQTQHNSGVSSMPASGQKLSDGEIQTMLDRLANDKSLAWNKNSREAVRELGGQLLSEGYDPAFVAGVMANVKSESQMVGLGGFESSAYLGANASKEPQYLKYMDKDWNYRAEYSGKSIEDVSLSRVYKMVCTLDEANYQQGKFGLGGVQWTGGRTKQLLETYMEVANGRDRITHEQVISAEKLMISREFQTPQYHQIYTNWQKNCSNTSSVQAAFQAGKSVCQGYEKPASSLAPDERGKVAESIYKVMMGL